MYEEANKILTNCQTKSKIRQYLYKSKHPNVRQLMPLLENVLVNKEILIQVSSHCTAIKMDENMKLCCLYDMLFSKNRKAQQLKDLKDTSLRKQFLQQRSALKLLIPKKVTRRIKPYKYARINGLKTCRADLVEEFGGTLKFDEDIPNLLCFKPNEDLANSELVQESMLIIQDKSSCFPAHVLNPPRTATVLDATASPGNKTLQLKESCDSVFACERDFKRFNFMTKRFESLNAQITCMNDDFLEMHPIDPVTHILLDPSCSGSGTLDFGKTYSDNEIINFALNQFQLVKRCLSYKNLENFTYSTCSVHLVENEWIVLAILYYARQCNIPLKLKQTNLSKFASKVADIDFDGLSLFLSANDISVNEDLLRNVIEDTPLHFCVRTNREEHLTGGFFVALFDLNK